MKLINLIIIILFLLLSNAYADFCGALLPTSPLIDAGTDDIEGIENMVSINGLPVIGKYPGDMPDIGAWEWFPGVD